MWTFCQQLLVSLCSVVVEIVDWSYQHIQNKIQKLFDNSEFFLERFWLFVDSFPLLFHCSSHHENLQSRFLFLQRLNLILVDIDVPVKVLHFSKKEFIGLNGLKDRVSLFEFKFENVINEPKRLIVVTDW